MEQEEICTVHTARFECVGPAWLFENHMPPGTLFKDRLDRITPMCRKIVVNYMSFILFSVDKLCPDDAFDSVFLTSVHYLDRVLAKSCIEPRFLQLLGVTCTLLAVKMNGTGYRVRYDDFLWALDGEEWTHHDFVHMEEYVLCVLDYKCLVPTCSDFLAQCAEYAGVRLDSHTYAWARFLCNLSVFNQYLACTSPRYICVFVFSFLLRLHPNSYTCMLQRLSGELQELSEDVHKDFENAMVATVHIEMQEKEYRNHLLNEFRKFTCVLEDSRSFDHAISVYFI